MAALKDENMFQPIEPGLAQYPAGSAEFVLGAATGVDPDGKTVGVATSSGDRTIAYDYLVIATGSGSANADMPWKATGTYEEDLARLHQTAEKVKAASHIVVAGAGATGVEVAGELRYEYRDKPIILLSGSSQVLDGVGPAASAERELLALGVEVRKGVRAVGTEALPGGRTKVLLQDGGSIETDLYLPTTGLVPNSSFLPAEFLTAKKFADVDNEFRVKAAKDVWALGDVVSRPRAAWLETEPQCAGVAKNIELAISGKPQVPVKGMPFLAVMCSVGRSRAVGKVGVVPVPSYVCYLAKGKTLGAQRLPSYTLDLLLDGLQVVRYALQATAHRALARALFQLPQLLALVVEQLLQLLLDQGRLGISLSPAPPLRNLLDLLRLLFQVLQLPPQPDLLPILRLLGGEVSSLGLETAPAEARQVLVAELGLTAGGGGVVRLGGPSRRLLIVDLVINLVALEARSQ
ncbi:Oxidoreductase ptaL [Paramyrothecium foliicola]|nr:Oxidoreductase ptaL [Paramyrothecium foliicola]